MRQTVDRKRLTLKEHQTASWNHGLLLCSIVRTLAKSKPLYSLMLLSATKFPKLWLQNPNEAWVKKRFRDSRFFWAFQVTRHANLVTCCLIGKTYSQARIQKSFLQFGSRNFSASSTGKDYSKCFLSFFSKGNVPESFFFFNQMDLSM